MKNVTRGQIAAFIRACHTAGDYGLVRCSSGNLSMRIDQGRLLVKASRSWMARMTPDDVALCRLSDGALIDGRKPSVEIGFHAGLLRARPDVNIVLHFQSPCATALACRKPRSINYFVIPEMPFYVGPVARVSYLPPGSDELARAVIGAMRQHDMVLLGNHGQVTVARDADHAIQNAAFFELACEIILRAGREVMAIPRRDVDALLALRRGAAGQV